MRTIALFTFLCSTACAQVTFDRLIHAASEPNNWLTFSGNLAGTRYSPLDRIKIGNAANLDLKWIYQAQALEKYEATPLVVDGVMYTVEPPNTVVAIDTRTGRPYWIYQHPVPPATYVCCGNINRGLAVLGDTLYLGTLDAQLVALDISTGRKKWQTKVAEYTNGYA